MTLRSALRRAFATAIFAGVTLFLVALPAMAAEAVEQDPAESSTGLIFRWLNFIIVFGGIGFLIAKHGGLFFRANAKAIAASIHEAAAEKAAAERELREVETKIGRLPQETTVLREEAKRDSTIEAERLRASARAEVEKIRQAARGELVAAERAAQQQLVASAASTTVDQAGEVVKSRMNPEIRARLFHAFLGELGRNSN